MTDPQSTVYQGDCMDFMAQFPNNYFELAIVDPPYGIGITKQNLGEGGGVYRGEKKYKVGSWDSVAPDPSYFDQLKRVSQNQIIFGANHFIDSFPFMCNSSCWIVWDKENGDSDFADCELAWTSFKKAVRKFKFRWAGMLQGNVHKKESRIHPTQKPVALYEWLLKNYAKEGDKILDTHMGSQSSRIASWKHGFDYWGSELDADYFKAGCERFERESKQPMLLKI